MTDPLVGESLAGYKIEAVLGQGGVGTVYRATSVASEQKVALKVLKLELSSTPTYVRRFLREARAASSVRHPHLVSVIDAGESEGRHWLAMELVEGTALHDLIETDGPLDIVRSIRLSRQVGSALDELHRKSFVHRDVKPSNVIVTPRGDAYLTDFGLLKGAAYTVLTRSGEVLGTLDYVAPEVIEGHPASAASDIYSLGCTIYTCLTGRAVFAGRSILQLTMAHLRETPPDPSALVRAIPPEMSRALLSALAKRPEERPPNATAFSRMLHIASKVGSGE